MTTTQKIIAAAGAAAIATGIYLASSSTPTNTINPTPTPLPVPYPGYWHEAPNALYYPCNVIPYQIYAQPNDGTPTYVRFEYSVMKVSSTHDTPSGAVNHVPAFYDHLGRVIPVRHTIPGPDDYFPKPTTAMRSNPPNPFPYDAALYWSNQNDDHSPDPPPTEAQYASSIASKGEWFAGQFPARMLAKQQQCSQQGPTRTQTPTVVPSQTPVPVVTCLPTVVTRIVVVTASPTASFQPAKTPTKTAFQEFTSDPRNEYGAWRYANGWPTPTKVVQGFSPWPTSTGAAIQVIPRSVTDRIEAIGMVLPNPENRKHATLWIGPIHFGTYISEFGRWTGEPCGVPPCVANDGWLLVADPVRDDEYHIRQFPTPAPTKVAASDQYNLQVGMMNDASKEMVPPVRVRVEYDYGNDTKMTTGWVECGRNVIWPPCQVKGTP